MTEEQKRASQKQRAEHDRKIQGLTLQRENILSQRTANPSRRAALEAALAQIESEIASLG